MKTKILLLFALIFSQISEAQTYSYTLVKNSDYNYSVAAVPDFDGNVSNPPNLESFGFTIMLEDGSSLSNITFSYLTLDSATEFTAAQLDAADPGQNRTATLITSTSGSADLPAHTSGDVIVLATFEILGTPTSGEISILDNNSDLAIAAGGIFNSYMSVDVTGGFSPTQVYAGQSGTTSYSFVATSTWYEDADSDTYGNPAVSQDASTQPAGYVADNTDCDDTNATINPDTVWYLDADGDNYAISTVTQCANPGVDYTQTVLPVTDCDDNDATINPDTIWYLDADGDNYAISTITQCANPGVDYTQTVLPLTDCNDNDATINPDTVWYLDADGDNYAVSTVTQCANPGVDYKQTVLPVTDCDDNDATINPGATEIPDNGIDDNCDGGSASTWYEDADSDTYGNPAVSQVANSQPAGYVADNTDCDDTNPGINPGATEIPGNGIDEDCDGGGVLSIDDELLAKSVRFYPNPAGNYLTIDSDITLTKIEIFSILGKKIKELNKDFKSIPIYDLSKGVYIVKLQSENGLATKKLIKK